MVDKFIFSAYFVILDMKEDKVSQSLWAQPFLATRTLIDVATRELIIRVNNEQVIFNIFKDMEYPKSADDYFAINIIKQTVLEMQEGNQFLDPLEHILTSKGIE